MTDRRYTDEEVAAIFLKAAEGPEAPPLQPLRSAGLTLAELQDIGREVGIEPVAVAQAARALELRGRAAARTFLGLPVGVERTVGLERRLTDEEWERLVVELREVFQAGGTVSAQGSLRQWTNGNLHVVLEPAAAGSRLRLGTTKGSARALMSSGLAVGGMAGAVAIASAAGGDVAAGLPGIALLAAAGVGMFASGALRVPGWARRRGHQFEEIVARLSLPVAAPTAERPPPRE